MRWQAGDVSTFLLCIVLSSWQVKWTHTQVSKYEVKPSVQVQQSCIGSYQAGGSQGHRIMDWSYLTYTWTLLHGEPALICTYCDVPRTVYIFWWKSVFMACCTPCLDMISVACLMLWHSLMLQGSPSLLTGNIVCLFMF